jgi:hypothetical protein
MLNPGMLLYLRDQVRNARRQWSILRPTGLFERDPFHSFSLLERKRRERKGDNENVSTLREFMRGV